VTGQVAGVKEVKKSVRVKKVRRNVSVANDTKGRVGVVRFESLGRRWETYRKQGRRLTEKLPKRKEDLVHVYTRNYGTNDPPSPTRLKEGDGDAGYSRHDWGARGYVKKQKGKFFYRTGNTQTRFFYL